MGYFLTLLIPLKEGIGGERDGDFTDNSSNGLFPYFGDTTERGDRGVKEMVTLQITLIMGYFLTLGIPLKEGIGGKSRRDGG
jgi:hypothetical protein